MAEVSSPRSVPQPRFMSWRKSVIGSGGDRAGVTSRATVGSREGVRLPFAGSEVRVERVTAAVRTISRFAENNQARFRPATSRPRKQRLGSSHPAGRHSIAGPAREDRRSARNEKWRRGNCRRKGKKRQRTVKRGAADLTGTFRRARHRSPVVVGGRGAGVRQARENTPTAACCRHGVQVSPEAARNRKWASSGVESSAPYRRFVRCGRREYQRRSGCASILNALYKPPRRDTSSSSSSRTAWSSACIGRGRRGALRGSRIHGVASHTGHGTHARRHHECCCGPDGLRRESGESRTELAIWCRWSVARRIQTSGSLMFEFGSAAVTRRHRRRKQQRH